MGMDGWNPVATSPDDPPTKANAKAAQAAKTKQREKPARRPKR